MAAHPLATAAALADVEQRLDAIDHAARAGLGHADRLALVDAARHLARRVDALVATLVGEAEQADSAMRAQRTPLPSLLAISATSAREAPLLVRAGRSLVAHPQVRDAALAGRVSMAQARAIDRVLGELPRTLSEPQRAAAEGALLARAPGRSAERLLRLGPEVLAEVAPDVVATDAGRLEAQTQRARHRRAVSWWHEDGSTHFRGNLPMLDAAPIVALLDAQLEADRRANRHWPDHRTADQKRADAFVAVVAARAGEGSDADERARVVVLLDWAKLREGAMAAGVLASGEAIAPGDLRRLCCEGEIVPAVLGGESEVLDLGRGARLATAEQRLALAVRDGGCIFPGCDLSPGRCQTHHLVPWWTGGRSDLGAMCLLCATHHALIEPRGPTGEPRRDQWRVVVDPLSRKPKCVPPLE